MSVERAGDGAEERGNPANRGISDPAAGEVTSVLPRVRADSVRTPPRRGYGRPGAPGSRPPHWWGPSSGGRGPLAVPAQRAQLAPSARPADPGPASVRGQRSSASPKSEAPRPKSEALSGSKVIAGGMAA